ncbi:MAG: DUF3592 domain-containing protein [Eubacterium sp.]|nr:DUF3592 domain-containing protein [Eubacterium sp.]MDE6154901.1 DUF3592 domain-containing protein [Eubacterium sp.]
MNHNEIMLIFGIFMLGFGIRALVQYFKENRNYTITTAAIVRYERELDHNHHNHVDYVSYTPIFEYTYNGKTYQEEHRVSSAGYGKGLSIVPASKYSIGDIVDVRVYDNGKKVYAVIDDENNIKMPFRMGLILTVAGVVFIAAAVYFGYIQ